MSHVAPWQSHYLADHWLRRLVHPPKKLFGRYVAEGMTALDIGCGMGVFALALARMVGSSGRVVAVDLQQEGLDVLLRRAAGNGLAGRVEGRRCTEADLGLGDLAGRIDFALAFWMVHEAPDAAALFAQIRAALKPGGRLFVAEPIFHVPASEFAQEVAAAQEAGLRPIAEPRVRFSRAAVFEAV